MTRSILFAVCLAAVPVLPAVAGGTTAFQSLPHLTWPEPAPTCTAPTAPGDAACSSKAAPAQK